jgi:hypothetical protein
MKYCQYPDEDSGRYLNQIQQKTVFESSETGVLAVEDSRQDYFQDSTSQNLRPFLVF